MLNINFCLCFAIKESWYYLNGTLKRRDKIFKCLNSIKVFKLIFFIDKVTLK